jgi:hypothetical protein
MMTIPVETPNPAAAAAMREFLGLVPVQDLVSAAPLDGSEFVGVIQSDSDRKVTVQDIANLAAGGGPLNNFTATSAPTVNDDSGDGYAVGSFWGWPVRGLLWQCVDATVGAAVWVVVRAGWLAGFVPIGFTNASTGGGTASSAGVLVTTAGTANNNPPQIADQQTHMQYATAATANADAGLNINAAGNGADFVLPSNSSPRIRPRALTAHCAFPDVSYGSGSTGTRIHVGLNPAQNMVGALGAAGDTNGIAAWFRYDTNAGDTNWQFVHRSTDQTSSAVVVNTGVPFTAGDQLIEFRIIVEGPNRLRWEIERIGTTDYATGVATTNLPVDRKIGNWGVRIRTLDAVARNVRWSRMAILERQI